MAFELPVDITLMVFRHLSPEDILRARQVCRSFYEITHLRSVWHNALRALQQHTPSPWISQEQLKSLNAQDLELYTFKVLRLRLNWQSSSPKSTIQREIISPTGCRTVSLHFTKDATGQYLISLLLNVSEGQRRFMIQCWDLAGSVPACIASRTFLQGFGGIAFNQQTYGNQVLAVLCPHLEILAIDRFDGFKTVASYPRQFGRVHLFAGPRILTQDGIGTLTFWSVERPDYRIALHNPQNAQAENILSAICDGDLVLVVRQTSLEVYAIPEMESPATALVQQQPIIEHRWQWRIDSVVLCPQRARSTRRHRSVSILIRFASLFPWPINLIHYYELKANTFYSPDVPNVEHILPYHFPPTLRQTIGSPVRLFAVSDMVMGPHGTAMWFDSHTEDFYGHSDRGQRLAGKHIQVSQDNDEEVVISDQITTTVADSVFAIHEHDSWVRLAMDEEEGRIAMGCNDGKILVFDYA